MCRSYCRPCVPRRFSDPTLSTRRGPVLSFADYRIVARWRAAGRGVAEGVPPAPASLELAKATDPARMRFHTIQKKGSSVVVFCEFRRGCRLSSSEFGQSAEFVLGQRPVVRHSCDIHHAHPSGRSFRRTSLPDLRPGTCKPIRLKKCSRPIRSAARRHI